MREKGVFNQGIRILLSVTLGLTGSFSFAVEVTVKDKGYNVRFSAGDRQDKIGYIAPGTVLEIPNQYRVLAADGHVDMERTLNNWLLSAGGDSSGKNSEGRPGTYKYSGKKRALFYPVKIKKWGRGSRLNSNFLKKQGDGAQTKEDFNGEIFVALSSMERRGRLLVTHRGADIDGVPLEQAKRDKSELPKSKYGHVLVGDRQATRELYQNPTRNITNGRSDSRREQSDDKATEAGFCQHCRGHGSAVDKLIEDLPKTLKKLSERTAASKVDFSLVENKVKRNFQRTCGVSFDSFTTHMKSRLDDSGMVKLLKRVMVKEAAGECQAENPEGIRPNSIGLFQVNLGSTDYLKCSASQRDRLKAMSIGEMERDGSVQCLENPAVNFKEAARIYKQKERVLFGSSTREGHFDRSKMTSDERLRLILSAYNGGEKWVIRAKRSLLEYNKHMGVSADSNKWEDLRLFYLRNALNRTEQIEMFGRNERGRKLKFALSNLVYTETIIPRDEI